MSANKILTLLTSHKYFDDTTKLPLQHYAFLLHRDSKNLEDDAPDPSTLPRATAHGYGLTIPYSLKTKLLPYLESMRV